MNPRIRIWLQATAAYIVVCVWTSIFFHDKQYYDWIYWPTCFVWFIVCQVWQNKQLKKLDASGADPRR